MKIIESSKYNIEFNKIEYDLFNKLINILDKLNNEIGYKKLIDDNDISIFIHDIKIKIEE